MQYIGLVSIIFSFFRPRKPEKNAWECTIIMWWITVVLVYTIVHHNHAGTPDSNRNLCTYKHTDISIPKTRCPDMTLAYTISLKQLFMICLSYRITASSSSSISSTMSGVILLLIILMKVDHIQGQGNVESLLCMSIAIV